MMSNLYCAINLLYAAQKNNVKRYLYTSTYGVYSHSSVMKEDSVWKTFPSENDKYAGWAKRMGELQVEAYKKEFKFKSLHIVRPANIYGPNMNFNTKSSLEDSSREDSAAYIVNSVFYIHLNLDSVRNNRFQYEYVMELCG
jgi:nucleoside-diphosphate-sugar epimerase